MTYVWSVLYEVRDFGRLYTEGEDYFSSYAKAKAFEDKLKAQCGSCDTCFTEITRYAVI